MTVSAPIRVTNTRLWVEELPRGERALRVCAIKDDDDRQIGIIEYVAIKLRGGKGTTYGWRPLHSAWSASRLRTMREAALKLSAGVEPPARALSGDPGSAVDPTPQPGISVARAGLSHD